MKVKITFLMVPMLFVVFCTFNIVGCNENTQSNKFTSISIEQGIENDSNIYLSSIGKEIAYIPLETTENSLISRIQSIRFYDDFLIVVDDRPQILVFDKNGKFIRKIGNKGKGPNEYIYVSQVEFSKKSNELYIFDGSVSKIMAFDINTGFCKKSKQINFYPETLSLLNDSILGFYCSAATFPFSNINYHLLLMDKNFVVIDSLWPEKNKPNIDLKDLDRGFIKTYVLNNKLIYWDSNMDTIFSFDIKSKTKAPEFKFDSKKYNVPANYKYSQKLYENRGDYFNVDGFIETNNYFFIGGIFGNRYGKHILYNKKTGNSSNVVFNYGFHDIGFHNDIDGGIPFWPSGNVSSNSVYDYMTPAELKELMKNKYYTTIKIKDTQKNQELHKYLDNSEVGDNPIIFILTLK